MQGVALRLYVQENRHYGTVPMYQWLVNVARHHQLPGVLAFRALTGCGHEGLFPAERGVDGSSTVPVVVECLAEAERIDRFIDRIKAEGLDLFYTRTPVEFGPLFG